MIRPLWRAALTVAVLAGSWPAWAEEFFTGVPPEGPVFQRPGPAEPPPPINSAGTLAPAPVYRREALVAQAAPTPLPSAPCTSTCAHCTPICAPPFTESTWYTRVDYFHWNERIEGEDFVDEDGTLVTLGYVRRIGPERFRIELFGGDVHYQGFAQYDDGTLETLSSSTGYLGVRGEYDLLFEPEWLPKLTFFIGIGTRFWVRDLRDGITDLGEPVIGYQETWWTIYPYFGLEKRRVLRDGIEFYGSGRIGFTAVTYQHVSLDDTTLYPRPGITGQMEFGLRGRRVFLSAFFEAMAWGESAVVRDALQPDSTMLTIGLRAGFCF